MLIFACLNYNLAQSTGDFNSCFYEYPNPTIENLKGFYQHLLLAHFMHKDICFLWEEENMLDKSLSLGKFLQLKRVDQGLSLERIAQITRISLYNLKFLENDQYNLLPGEIYTRGYLKSYARVLRLDPEEIIKLYHQQRHFQNMPSKADLSLTRSF